MTHPGHAVAIVGIACEYPDATSPAELWENVLACRRAFRRVPPERLRLEDYWSADRGATDAIYSTEAAVLEGYRFDRLAFKVSGPSYRAADLAHWLALDVAHRALADAGFDGGDGLPRDTTAVILGNTLTGEFSRAGLMRLRWPYVQRVVDAALDADGLDPERRGRLLRRIEDAYKAPFEPVGDETLAGGLSNTIGGRICNHLDLHGGGYTVDAACAASLLAVTAACSQLAAGDIDVALAGGVDLSLDPFELVGFAKVGALAAEEMRVYDARSAGFWPGEGCGMAVLMRLEDAVARRRRVHAIVRGFGVSSDGAGGLTRPEQRGQVLALRRAYGRAGVDPGTPALFEGHGTGTAVGDATELRALATVRAGAAVPAAIGSVKANIGHTKAAAGIAGLLKATLAVREGLIPPTTGADSPHPELERAQGALRVVRGVERWPDGLPVRAGVSAMGFGGINTHVVLDGPGQAARRRAPRPRERRLAASAQDVELFAFAADTPAALARAIAALRPLAARLSRAELADAAAALAPAAHDGPVRAAVLAASGSELAQRLDLLARVVAGGGEALGTPAGVFCSTRTAPPRIGFLFPGQGSPSHRDGGALRRRFPAMVEPLYVADRDGVRDAVATEVAQPAIVTASLAGLRVLAAVGIEATLAVGHSLGELTALAWAGVCGEAAAQRLAAARGRAMADHGAAGGAMASVAAPADEAAGLGEGLPVVVAARNSARQTVFAGPGDAIDALIARSRGRGRQAARLRVSHAFHSPLVADAASAFAEVLAAEPLDPPRRTVVSTVTGRPLEAATDLRDLLCRQITSPVRFEEALAIAAEEADLLIEAGPGAVLTGLAGDCVPTPAVAVDAGGPSLAGLLGAVAAAWALGAPVAVDELSEGRFTRPFDPCRPLSFLENPCERAPRRTLAAPPPAPAVAPDPTPAPSRDDPPELVRRLVAERAEMPVEAVGADSRMLDDLHLTSIVVGEIAVQAARRLGLPAPLAPNELANATVAELAAALADPRRKAAGADGVEPPGAGPWVRPFSPAWVERPPRPRPASHDPGRWQVFASPGDPLAHELRAALEQRGGEGVALCVPPPGAAALPLLVEAAQAALAARRFLVLQRPGCLAAALARSVHLEAPRCHVAVVSGSAEQAAAEAVAARGFVEVRHTEDGRRLEPVLRRLTPAGGDGLPLGPDDVVLVTGGAKGIAVECLLPLARASGAALAVLGRSDASDPRVADGLRRLREAGIRVRYVRADVTERAAVRAAVAALGRVTAVVHAAGVNEPRLLGDADAELFAATLAPKVDGLRHVLEAVEGDRLRLLVTFGSVIARIGMRGDAHYALANEWLRALTERFAAEHPACACLAFESSVWAAVGMGERLGSVGALAQQGVQAIPPDVGAATLEALLRTRDRPVSVVVAGRFGRPPTLRLEDGELPLLRFLERPLVHYPGIELVADAELSEAIDPYLGDHVIDGDRLLPAVLGLEAMAQGIAALAGTDAPPVFEEVRFQRPIVVPPGERTTVRVAVLADGTCGTAVLRSERTGFGVDHFCARWRLGEPPPGCADLPIELGADAAVDADPGDLYGSLLFQGGRFRRLRRYRRLTATECVAELDPAVPEGWFGVYMPQELLLGDPGARDAALHAVQACIPHVRVLPTGVAAVWPGAGDSPGPWVVHARERRRSDAEFVYDLVVTGADGRVRERWDGLTLRAVSPAGAAARPWPEALLVPLLHRHAAAGVRVAVTRTGLARRERSREAVARAGVAPDGLRHRADGRPELEDGGAVSTAHADGLTLAVVGDGIVACDVETVTPRAWPELLGRDRAELSAELARARGEDPDAAAARVWAAGECLVKAGVGPGAPLTLHHDDHGWVVLSSGRTAVGTYVARVHGTAEPLVVALLTEAADAGV